MPPIQNPIGLSTISREIGDLLESKKTKKIAS